MAITFCPLFSGSSGNALFIASRATRILVDAGLPGRTVSGALAEIGVLPETLDGILVTHEHSDHIKGVGVLARKYRIPVYANERTWAGMERCVGQLSPGQRRVFDTGDNFFIGDLEISSFPIPHDAAEPVAYRVFHGGHSVATATDIGHFTKRLLGSLSGVDLLLLESNHDPELLLHNDRYSQPLKARILGDRGHLSNEDCARALVSLYKTGVRHAVLGHLSGENNSPELALATVCQNIALAGIAPDADLRVDMAWRDHVGEVYTLA